MCNLIHNVSHAAPSIGLSNFHITILNSTTVEAVWRLPYATTGINGIVRGFKIYVVKVNGTRQTINVEDPAAQTYIITGLEQSATYLFSIVIYTVGDGPQSIILHITMPDSGDHDNSSPVLKSYQSLHSFCSLSQILIH